MIAKPNKGEFLNLSCDILVFFLMSTVCGGFHRSVLSTLTLSTEGQSEGFVISDNFHKIHFENLMFGLAICLINYATDFENL